MRKRFKTIFRLLIDFLVFSLLAWTMISAGITPFKWQYWVILLWGVLYPSYKYYLGGEYVSNLYKKDLDLELKDLEEKLNKSKKDFWKMFLANTHGDGWDQKVHKT